MDEEAAKKTIFVFRTTNPTLVQKLLEIQTQNLDPLAQKNPEYFDFEHRETLRSELLKIKILQDVAGSQPLYPVVGGTFPSQGNWDLSGKTVKIILTNYNEYVRFYQYRIAPWILNDWK